MNFNFCPNCGKEKTVRAINKTTYRCNKCDWQFWNNAKAAVAVVIIDTSGHRMLVCKRDVEPNKGLYDLPGGFVDFGETAQQAARREAKEELGVILKIENLELLATYHNHYDENTTTVDIVFLVRPNSLSKQAKFQAKDDVALLEWKPFSFINDPKFCEVFYTGLDRLIQSRLDKQRS